MTHTLRSGSADNRGKSSAYPESVRKLPRTCGWPRRTRELVYLQAAITGIAVLAAAYDSQVGCPSSIAVAIAVICLLASGAFPLVALLHWRACGLRCAISAAVFLIASLLAVIALYALTVFVR